MDIWDKYKGVFLKNGVCRFVGEVVWYDAVNSPYINTNRVSSVLLQFITNREVDVSWSWEETGLAMLIVDTEIKSVESYLGCNIKLIINNKIFSVLDDGALNFLLESKVTSLSMVSDLDVRDYFASYIRYIKEPDGSVNMDKVYIESIRDPRR